MIEISVDMVGIQHEDLDMYPYYLLGFGADILILII